MDKRVHFHTFSHLSRDNLSLSYGKGGRVMDERELLKQIVIQHPEICETLLEIVRLIKAQKSQHPTATELTE